MAQAKEMKLKYPEMPKDAKGLQSVISTAFRSETKARHAIQVALVAIAFWAWKHGDWTAINTLLDPKNGIKTGRSGAIRWACQFIGLDLVNKKDEDGKELKVKEFGNFKGAKYIEANFNGDKGAKATMYWTLEPKDDFKAYDVNDIIRSAMKSRATMAAKIKDGKYTAEEVTKINLKLSDDVIRMLANAAREDGSLVEVTFGEAAQG